MAAGIELGDSKARSKKIEQLLNKVKKVTGNDTTSAKTEKLLALPSSQQAKSKSEEDTFITGGGIKSSG